MASFIDAQGATQQVDVSLDMFKAAVDNGMSLRDYTNATFQTDVAAYGDVFSQLAASEGIFLKPQRDHGLRTPTLAKALNGSVVTEAGAVVHTPSSSARVLLQAAIGALVEDKLVANLDMAANAYSNMLAMDTTIAGEWLLWPEANYTNTEAARAQVTSQLAKPASMLALTTSEKQVRIPTFALGIEWSEQAAKYLNLDFIALSVARQIAVERNARAEADILALLNGDPDVGQASLSSLSLTVQANTLDSTISANGTLTQKAWMAWLYRNGTKRRITHVICDVTTAVAIQNRTGRPTIYSDNGVSPRVNTNERYMNPLWNDDVEVYIATSSAFPANTIIGLDKEYGIQRVTSVGANYNAVEELVMRRGTQMRFDYGSISRRLYNDAFDVLLLTV